jgi:hypothetical protein
VAEAITRIGGQTGVKAAATQHQITGEGSRRNRDRDYGPFTTFEPSLFVLATVMSRPAEDRAIVDAGLKALAFDSGPPLVYDEPAVTYERGRRARPARPVGRHQPARARRQNPPHLRPLTPDRQPLLLVCVRGNRVEQVWPITARGAVD